jgi:GNAT superfamily N-acetyltransferase
MALRYRRATPDEVDALHAIVAACGEHLLAAHGLAHWVPAWPLERMRAEAAEREVWSVWDGERLVGTFTVGLTPIAAYRPEIWRDADPALYLNRLAVPPSLQGAGVGRECMAEIERLARERGCRTVRFDAVTAMTAVCDFYRRLGYADRGPFLLGDIHVTCFEKVV